MANSVYESGVINSVWLQLVVMVIIRDSIFLRFILQNEKERCGVKEDSFTLLRSIDPLLLLTQSNQKMLKFPLTQRLLFLTLLVQISRFDSLNISAKRDI